MANTTGDYLVFYYEIADVLEAVQMESHYKGKNLMSQEKEPKARLDDVSVTGDEEEVMMRLLKKAVTNIFDNLKCYAKEIENAFLFNAGEEIGDFDNEAVYDEGDMFYYGIGDEAFLYRCLADDTPAGSDPEDDTLFEVAEEWENTYGKIRFLLNEDDEMDYSFVDNLDTHIEDAIVKGTLLLWYKLIQETQAIALADVEYDTSLREMNSAAWHRKTKQRRQTNMI